MNVVIVYLRIYAACALGAVRAIAKSPWTLLLPLLSCGVYLLVVFLAHRLGPLAGVGLALVQAALLSGYFYFVREGVAGSKVGLGELWKSLGAYLWAFVGVAFVLWVVSLVLTRFLSGPSAGTAMLLVSLLEFVLLNAVPEVITQRGTTGGLATIQASIEFTQENWLEWLLPNAAVGAMLWYGYPLMMRAIWELYSGQVQVVSLVLGLGAGALLHFAALFRGFLFRELDGSRHRQRMFKYQTQ